MRKFMFIIADTYTYINHSYIFSLLAEWKKPAPMREKFNPDTYSEKINFIGNVEAKYR